MICGGLELLNVLGRDLLPSFATVEKIEGIFNSQRNLQKLLYHKTVTTIICSFATNCM